VCRVRSALHSRSCGLPKKVAAAPTAKRSIAPG
jgi:hypothetical protein